MAALLRPDPTFYPSPRDPEGSGRRRSLPQPPRDQLRAAVKAVALVETLEMRLDSPPGHAEAQRDLLVRETISDEQDDLPLTSADPHSRGPPFLLHGMRSRRAETAVNVTCDGEVASSRRG